METNNAIIANCTNCEYVLYKHTDGIRLERCKVFHRKEKFNSIPINPEARDSVLNGSLDLCERYSPASQLENQGMEIIYDLIE